MSVWLVVSHVVAWQIFVSKWGSALAVCRKEEASTRSGCNERQTPWHAGTGSAPSRQWLQREEFGPDVGSDIELLKGPRLELFEDQEYKQVPSSYEDEGMTMPMTVLCFPLM